MRFDRVAPWHGLVNQIIVILIFHRPLPRSPCDRDRNYLESNRFRRNILRDNEICSWARVHSANDSFRPKFMYIPCFAGDASFCPVTSN